jgi:membrane protein YdbS with pleckstrin-like domain
MSSKYQLRKELQDCIVYAMICILGIIGTIYNLACGAWIPIINYIFMAVFIIGFVGNVIALFQVWREMKK